MITCTVGSTIFRVLVNPDRCSSTLYCVFHINLLIRFNPDRYIRACSIVWTARRKRRVYKSSYMVLIQ
jgi:hypothetical protein